METGSVSFAPDETGAAIKPPPLPIRLPVADIETHAYGKAAGISVLLYREIDTMGLHLGVVLAAKPVFVPGHHVFTRVDGYEPASRRTGKRACDTDHIRHDVCGKSHPRKCAMHAKLCQLQRAHRLIS